jgi:hypothetical protein
MQKFILEKIICLIQKKSNIVGFEKVRRKLGLLYKISISLC